ncbi:MAG: preprotein translocase subunit YajC [Methylotenera sp.]|nr:preprotein translocase subunit YajC [Oligoflexia bacterium]
MADGPAVPAGSAPVTGAAATTAPSGLMQAIPFVAMFAIMYFLMIRPQQKKAKQQAEMMNQLKSGDDVLTTSGILGKVTGVTEKVVTLEIADDVRVKVLKSQVSQLVKGQL